MGRIKPSLLFPKSIQSIYRTPHDQTNLNNAGPLASHLKSRSVVRFGGPDTLKFLQGLLTNDVHKFGEPPCERDKTSTLPTPNMPYESASPVYAALLTPQGRFLYDLFLYSTPQPEEKLNQTGSGPGSGSDDGSVEVFADVDGSVLDELLQTFKKYQLRSKVEIESVAEDFSCWQHYGGNVSQKSSSIEELEAAGVGWGSGVDRLACQLHVLLILDGNGLRIPDWIVLDPEESSNLVQYDLWLKLTKKQMKRITFCGD